MSDLRILATGTIVAGGDVQWKISPLVEEVAPDGTLQDIIDSGEETAEYEDDILDREFWSRGEW